MTRTLVLISILSFPDLMTSTSSYNEAFANQVSRLVIEKYNKLPKTGKPNVNESQWTLLSGICLEENGQLSVVALATGTKCLGVTSYSRHGDVLHDSHAEGGKGRGDPTYSMSCSDKIAKWNAVGWEGTLLSMLVTAPIFMSSISVGGGIAFSQDALQRALLTRVSHLIVPPPPALLKADVVFPAGKRSVKREMKRLGRPICSAHPVGASIIWCNATYRPLEISIEGIKQGVSRKRHNMNNATSTLLVSSYKLLLQFIQLSRREECVNLPYTKVKLLASEYQERMNHCKEALGKWLEVPEEFRQFAVKDMNEKL
ncbi:tRNA-specific adenosine deaminase 1-like [Diaphorina citri]|uniref:tRNA-specific adenosine deaminase 1 n=1 Tax=Diaphorina citri TaxID=121845 RepID=A0A3Q0J1B1_DIACI|nr:tRNA-specific adenosine deaminase 1-like [Diaphorina citri]